MAGFAIRLLAAVFIFVAAFGPSSRADEGDLRALFEAAKAAGPDAPDMAQMVIAPATSQQLLRQGDIDFKFATGIDMPIDLQPGTLTEALMGPVDKTGRFVIIFDVAMAKASRKVRDVKEVESFKVVEVVRRDNPAYERAARQVDKLGQKADKLAAKDRPISPKLERVMGDAQGKLAATPPFLEQKILGPYKFKAADTDATKALTVNYYVIDKISKRYVKSTFDVVENQHFVMAFNVDPSDPAKDRVHADYTYDKDVRDWERAAVIIPLSSLLKNAVQRLSESQPYTSPQPLLAMLAQDRSAAAARLESERFDARPLNDPRFDSVVAIFRPDGLGSGFYVRSNIVLTNWHVVEKLDIIEIKRFDGRETFGQVIGRDTRLDLALIKVQDRGRPVEFMTGKDVKPGDITEVIGHPLGYGFTITRGQVSAIRRLKPAMLDTGSDGWDAMRSPPGSNYVTTRAKDNGVLYIQTDAAINHGNSGGPMFIGNKVVGISDWSRADRSEDGRAIVGVPGLNFTVHYSEAVRFINDALKGE
jgi:serine protease Do